MFYTVLLKLAYYATLVGLWKEMSIGTGTGGFTRGFPNCSTRLWTYKINLTCALDRSKHKYKQHPYDHAKIFTVIRSIVFLSSK
jgi:hypothetical protein